ncbi:MAG: alpha-ketoglutarate-dependent dioxygenase AlkB [Rhodanobacter sp.]
MMQPSLFEPAGPQVLLDDDSGRIVLAADVVSDSLASRWFDALRAHVSWNEGRRLMYEREVDVPRLRAHFNVDDPCVPPVLLEALAAVNGVAAAPYDSIGLNFYRDRHDSVAPHNDKLADLVRGQPIALLSLGATRRMTIRAKAPPKRVLRLDLEQGSVIIMSWLTQLHYDHGIPKEIAARGPRISLAFRVRGSGARR